MSERDDKKLIGKRVIHKEYGQGELVGINGALLFARFNEITYLFDYPEAFEKKYLIVDDFEPAISQSQNRAETGSIMNNHNRTRNYYMVRAQKSGEKELAEFVDNDVVAVGWRDVSFSECKNAEEVRDSVEKAYYLKDGVDNRKKGRKLNEVVRFKNISEGDYILVPYYSDVALAVAKKEEVYSEAAYDLDMSNQRRVSYEKRDNELYLVSRKKLSTGLQNKIKGRGVTVSDLNSFAEEIDSLFKNN